MDRCPVCGEHDAFMALGQRVDHPHRWRPWASEIADLYLCGACDALVEARMGHGHGVEIVCHDAPGRAA